MASNLVQVTLNHDSALPEDVTVNAWSFNTGVAKDTTAAIDIVAKLQTFYNAFASRLSASLAGTGSVKFYDRADLKPRVPWFTGALVIVPGTSNLASEVSLTLSFSSDVISGVPAARRRGRLFLGPLASSVNDATSGRPITAAVTEISNAAGVLQTASANAAGWGWEIYSRTDLIGRDVLRGYVDNAFDTQRRRGLRPTTRTLWGIGS